MQSLILVMFFWVALFSMIDTRLIGPVGDMLSLVYKYGINPMCYVIAVLVLRKLKAGTYLMYTAFSFVSLLLFYQLVSVLWSDYKIETIQTFVNNLGFLLICMAMAVDSICNKRSYVDKIVCLVLTLVALSLILERIGVASLWLDGRYRGIFFHPNTLGALCVFGVWISLHNIETSTKNMKLLRGILLVLSIYSTYLADSMTSFVLSMSLVSGMIVVNRIGGCVNRGTRAVVFIVILVLSGGALAVTYSLNPSVLSVDGFFSAIGRDSSFTGRDTLWDMAFDFIHSHFYVGSGFDSLRKFCKQYGFLYGQIHNGYIEIFVKGGVIGFFLFFLVIAKNLLFFSTKLLRLNAEGYGLFYLFICLLIHNFMETSFFRPVLFWFCFLYISIHILVLQQYERCIVRESA